MEPDDLDTGTSATEPNAEDTDAIDALDISEDGFDTYGNQIAAEEDAPQDADAPAEASADVPAVEKSAAPTYVPPPIPGLTLEQQEALNELAITNPVAAMQQVVQIEIARHTQSMSVASANLRPLQEAAPEFYRIHGAAIERELSTFPAEARQDPKATGVAVVRALGQQILASEDQYGTLRAFAQAILGDVPQTPAAPTKRALPVEKRPVIPAGQRVPTAGAASTRSNAPTRPRENATEILFPGVKGTR